MDPNRTVKRRILDTQLAGLGQRVGARPPKGWVRTIREALGMSSYELAKRMGLSATRVRQFEKAEVKGAIQVSTLARAAQALNCTLVYAFAPNERLEDIVYRQALHKAAAELSLSICDDRGLEDQDEKVLRDIEELEELTHHLIDRQGLWQESLAAP
jgi:predicted DNA-binding mobile mystery protein A